MPLAACLPVCMRAHSVWAWADKPPVAPGVGAPYPTSWRDGDRDDQSRARKEAVSPIREEHRLVATNAPSRSRLGSKPTPDRPERAELPVGRHAHAVRGRLLWRRPLTSLTPWCQGRKGQAARQDRPLHAPLGRDDRRKGAVERNGQRDDRGVAKRWAVPTLQNCSATTTGEPP